MAYHDLQEVQRAMDVAITNGCTMNQMKDIILLLQKLADASPTCHVATNINIIATIMINAANEIKNMTQLSRECVINHFELDHVIRILSMSRGNIFEAFYGYRL